MGKINVLFVDDESDILKQGKIYMERADENLKVITEESPSRALELTKEKDFDIVISDYEMEEMTGIDLLKKVREEDEEILFVMLTAKGDVDIAIEALNLGADKYFKKTKSPREQFRELAEVIETLVSKKYSKKSQIDWSSYPSGTKDLLRDMLNDDIRSLKPTWSESQIKYPKILEYMDLSPEKSLNMLNALVEDDILVEKIYDRYTKCRNCGSAEFRFKLLCPGCGKPKIRRENLIEHLDCGFNGPKNAFVRTTGEYICPKCDKELKAIGVDYKKMTDVYICDSCEEIFSSPDQKLDCTRCGDDMFLDEVKSFPAFEYQLKPTREEWLKKQLG
ncbi:MAG: response regulator [Candidatus Natronoplasma sp.]